MSKSRDFCFAGIDVGSTTVKFVLIDPSGDLLMKEYRRARGRAIPPLLEILRAILRREKRPCLLGLTGSGGERIARHLGALFVNEVVAQPAAVQAIFPPRRGDLLNVIEMGGQDSKFMVLGADEEGTLSLRDAVLNDLCAAGTGSFLDQQAERLGIPVESLGELALRGRDAPANIAGRCTVFCKSDMVHLQQIGIPLEQIAAGLCLAVARNFKQTMINRLREKMGKSFLFQGGVAHNPGMVWAFETILPVLAGTLVVPEHREVMAAMGVALKLRASHLRIRNGAEQDGFPECVISSKTIARVELLLSREEGPVAGIPPLRRPTAPALSPTREEPFPSLPVYLGVDIGSTTSKVVLLDPEGRLRFSRYVHTNGKPIELLRSIMGEMGRELGDRIVIRGAGVTGSGRQVAAQYLGADLTIDEINAQALGVVHLVGPVDAIIDIGGQDSKFLSLDSDGLVADFVMNRACAAGTGAFLEEQAGRLKIRIRDEFADLAFAAASPCSYNATCAVFMEQDLVNHQQRGASLPSLVGGLAMSMAKNYARNVGGSGIERLKGKKKRLVFTGGVANNLAVVAALEAETGQEVIVSPFKELTGAIGAAVAVLKSPPAGTRMKKLATIENQEQRTRVFVCRACSNLCTVNAVSFGSETPAHYGARCEKFDGIARSAPRRDDLVSWRNDLVFAPPPVSASPGAPVAGIPRTLAVYDLFPFLSFLLTSLGMTVRLSEPTNPRIADLTNESCKSTVCHPAKLAVGHVQSLINDGVDLIFFPTFLQREPLDSGKGDAKGHWYCNYIGAAATTARAALGFSPIKGGGDFLARRGGDPPLLFSPPLDLSQPLEEFVRQLALHRRRFGWTVRRIRSAVGEAWIYQETIQQTLREKGEEFLEKLKGSGEFGIVLTGRAYNLYDPGANGDLPRILRNLGVPVLPAECLDVRGIDISLINRNMFWHTGQWILRTGEIARREPNLYPLYLSCFGCGPDSFVANFFTRDLMAGKPHLVLEIDDHTASGGIQTRCEAFITSIRLRRSHVALSGGRS